MKLFRFLLVTSLLISVSNAFGQDWMPFQPQVRYTYSYLKGGKRLNSSNTSSVLTSNPGGKWISFQSTFPVGANNEFVLYPWLAFDSLQCPININWPDPPVSIALPSAIWGAKAGITTDGWVKLYYNSYVKPIDSVQFNIHTPFNQDFVYKPSTGATARLTQKSRTLMVTQVFDSTLTFETSDNQTFQLSKRNGFVRLPTLGATNPEWIPENLQLAAAQGLPGVHQFKKKVKDLIRWQPGDTVGYSYKVYVGTGGMVTLNYDYWIRYSILQREELYHGDSIRLTVQKNMLRRTYSTPGSSAQPDFLFPPSTETVTIGYPSWADTLGNTNGLISNRGTDFSFFSSERSSFKEVVAGHSLSGAFVHQPMEVKDGRRVYSYHYQPVALDTCPGLTLRRNIILDGGGWMSSFSDDFGQVQTISGSVLGNGIRFELDCYRMNGAGPGCTPLLVLSTNPAIKPETWEIFPNPGTHMLHLKGAAWKTLSIRDVQGKQWLSVDGNLKEEQIDVRRLPSGLFFISITGQNGERQGLKWVKE